MTTNPTEEPTVAAIGYSSRFPVNPARFLLWIIAFGAGADGMDKAMALTY